jgi:hypothetical protein
MNTRVFCIAMIGAFSALFTPVLTSIYADPSMLEGTVMDSHWHPVSNAIVRIEAKKGGFSDSVKTDANGHYSFGNLDPGTHRVTLLVNGMVKAMINNAKTTSGESRRLDFNLTGRLGARATHLVYLTEEKGSHLGGHWVDVDKLGRPNNVTVDNIQTLNQFDHSDNNGFSTNFMHINVPNYDKTIPAY